MLHRERTIHSPVSLISISLGTKISARRILTFIPSCSLLYLLSSYLISENVVYLTIAEKSYPRKLAFSYLDELAKEFATVYGPKVEAARKPYAFVGFGQFSLNPFHGFYICSLSPGQSYISDTFMQKTARLYQDTRTASATAGSNLERLNDDLQDVTRIMTKNMEELLWRGDSLDSEFSDFIFIMFGSSLLI